MAQSQITEKVRSRYTLSYWMYIVLMMLDILQNNTAHTLVYDPSAFEI